MKYILIYSSISSGTGHQTFDTEEALINFVEEWFETPGEEFEIVALYNGTPLKFELVDRVKSIKVSYK